MFAKAKGNGKVEIVLMMLDDFKIEEAYGLWHERSPIKKIEQAWTWFIRSKTQGIVELRVSYASLVKGCVKSRWNLCEKKSATKDALKGVVLKIND